MKTGNPYITIYDPSGQELLNAIVTKDCKRVQTLMSEDYEELSWVSNKRIVIPVGSYIFDPEGEKLSLYDSYKPEQSNEAEYKYTPKFYSRIYGLWGKTPLFFYNYDSTGKIITSREPDWNLTDNAKNILDYITTVIKVETGEEWKTAVAADLGGYKTLQFSNTDIVSALNALADEWETEWYVDKSTKTIHLGKAFIKTSELIRLKVGSNINPPSITDNKEGYFNRFYIFGSTRNITQEYRGANINNLINKRLTLDPSKYPNGYIDKRKTPGEPILSKSLIFDEIYPKSGLVIAEARPRLMFTLDNDGNKIQIGTDSKGNPIYDTYSIWYLQLKDSVTGKSYKLANTDTYSNENPDGVLISGKTLSIHFSSGSLLGREFELSYHDRTETITNTDGTPFEVKAGDFEILYTKDEEYIVPAQTGLIPVIGDTVIIFNIRMPEEYIGEAYKELEEVALKEISLYETDRNNYEFKSNPVAFATSEDLLNLKLGQSINYENDGYFLETRIIHIEKNIDFPCEQTIRLGNEQIKGTRQELKEEVANASKDINLITSFNQVAQSAIDSYNRAIQQMNEGFARISRMWEFDPLNEDTIFSKYNVYSLGGVSAKGFSKVSGELPAGSTTLAGLTDVDLSGLTAGQSLVWNGTKWVNQLVQNGGLDYTQLSEYLTANNYAKKNDIPSLTGYATEQWVKDRNYLTAVSWDTVTGKPSWIGATKPSYAFSELTTHPTTLAGYGITDAITADTANASFVTALGIKDNSLTWTKNGKTEEITIPFATAATRLADITDKTAWGQTFFTGGQPQSISGNMTNVGTIGFMVGTRLQSSADHAGFGNGSWTTLIGFHTKYLYANASGSDSGYNSAYALHVNGAGYISGLLTANGGVTIPATASLKIGDATITWDATNKGLHISGGGLYSDSYISAKGVNTSGGSGTGSVGGGMSYSRLDNWSDYLPESQTWVLSAKLGYDLHTRLNTATNNIAGLQSSMGNFVTLDTAQTIIGVKTFEAMPYLKMSFDTSNAKGINWRNAANTSTIASIIYHNTAQSLYINPQGSTDVWNDIAGNYSLRIGVNVFTYNTNPILHAGNYSSYALPRSGGSMTNTNLVTSLNADLLDGYHESSFFRSSISTVAEDLTAIPGNRSGSYVVNHAGWSGSAIVFHSYSSNSGLAFYRPGGSNSVPQLLVSVDSTSNWSNKGTILTTEQGNAVSATRLQDSYTLWGQTFYGNNVTGNMTGVGTIFGTSTKAPYLQQTAVPTAVGSLGGAVGIGTVPSGYGIFMWGTGDGNGHIQAGRNDGLAYSYHLCLQEMGGNVGIGTTSPSYKLQVNGESFATHFNTSSTNVVTNLNADLLDGHHSTSFEGCYSYEIDTSSLNNNVWYPVTIGLETAIQTRIRIEGRNTASGAWNVRDDKGIAYVFDYTTYGSGWGWATPLRVFYQALFGAGATGNPICGFGQLTNSSTEYVFVRGGGKYMFRISRPNITPVLRTETYTISSQSIAPTSTQPELTVRNNALITDNVASSSKLQTARTLWGQSFDGSGNVTGNLSSVGSITPLANASYLNGSATNNWSVVHTNQVHSNSTLYLQSAAQTSILFMMNGTECARFCQPNGYLGLGTTAPTYRLHCVGTAYFSGATTIASTLTANDGVTIGQQTGTGRGLSLYGGTYSSLPPYGISFALTSTYGTCLGVSGDWATYFTMSGANTRGWVFRNIQTGTNVASVNGEGWISMRGGLYYNSGDGTMKIMAIDPDNGYGAESVALQTSFDGQDPATSTYPSTYPSRSILALQPRGGNVVIGGYGTSTYKLHVNGVIFASTGIFSNGYVSAKGQNTSSDERLKQDFKPLNLSLAEIANAPSITFRWKKDGSRDFGTVAQYWQRINPLFARTNPEGDLTLDYGKIAHTAIVNVAKKTMNHEQRIQDLERENKELKKQIAELKRA